MLVLPNLRFCSLAGVRWAPVSSSVRFYVDSDRGNWRGASVHYLTEVSPMVIDKCPVFCLCNTLNRMRGGVDCL